MWRGRFQLGQEVVLGLLTTNTSGVPTAPDAAPTFKVWGPDETVVASGKVPALDRYQVTGMFRHILFLGSPFAVGLQSVVYNYLLSGSPRIAIDTFEVVAGGNILGAVQSLHVFHRPHGEFVVQQLSSGAVAKNRNPRV